MKLRAPICSFLLATCCLMHWAAADEHVDAALRLLDAGWRISPAANRQIDVFYRSLPASSHVDFAYALAKLRQSKYDDAIAATAAIVDDPIHGLYARRMRIWLMTLRKKYSDALIEMERMAAKLPAGALTEEQKAQREELIVFLGRTVGFMRGPAHTAVTDFEIESRARRILASFSDEEKDLFAAESQRVLDEYLARVDDRDRMVVDATRAAEEEAKRRKKELDDLRKRVNGDMKKLEDERKRLDEDANAQLNLIAERDQPLRSQLATLDSQAAFTQSDLASVVVQIRIVQDQLADTDDPAFRDYLLRELARLNSLYYFLSDELAQLDYTAAGVQSQRSELAAQQQSLENRYAQRRSRLENDWQSLEKLLRRAEREEKKMGEENVGIRRAARSRDAKANALPTYVPYPAEAERERLLAL